MKQRPTLIALVLLGLALTASRVAAQIVYTPYTFYTWATGITPSGVALDSAGNVYVTDLRNHLLLKFTPTGAGTILAGSAGSAGSTDGPGSEARFNGPSSVAVDWADNIYVADYFNFTIRKVTPDGAVTTLAGLAGDSGSADGSGSEARFNFPWGVAVDGAGIVYVADTGNGTIRKITPDGAVTTLAGLAGSMGAVDDTGTEARFNQARGVAVDGAGNVYVADTWNHKIRKVTPQGVVTTLAGLEGNPGSADGTGSAARFSQPFAVAVDSAGNIYVGDTANNAIRRVTIEGVVTTLGGVAGTGPSYRDGTGSGARFNSPQGLAVDGNGNLYVADYFGQTVRQGRPAEYTPYTFTNLAGNAGFGSDDGMGRAARFNHPGALAIDSFGNLFVSDEGNGTIRKMTPDGVVTTLAGMAGVFGWTDGTGNGARFGRCESGFFGDSTCRGTEGLAADITGNLYVADTFNHAIRKVTPAGVVTTLAGSPGVYGSSDGLSRDARFYSPRGLAVDPGGNVLVTETGNLTVRKISPDGVVTTLAGSPGEWGSADGRGSVARFKSPWGIAVEDSGQVFVADSGNSTIRKISPTGEVTTVAGSAGQTGSVDGVRSDARFSDLRGLALDRSGNLYVADNGASTLRKVTPQGVVTTLAGLAGSSGWQDGRGNAARFDGPNGVVLDGEGNVYVTDQDNNTLRKVTPDGDVTTLAGQAGGGWGSQDGTGPEAQFGSPSGVAVDHQGNTYVADTDNNSIRKITSAGEVTTLAGSTDGSSGSTDGTGTSARFYSPVAVAVDHDGNVYVADNDNSTIRKITSAGEVTTLAGSAGQTGSADGAGTAAQFYWPNGVAVDGTGIVYVADTYNHTIRKVTPAGVVTTLAGLAGEAGNGDGAGSLARFSHPTGVAVDRAGNVYVTDTDYATIRKVTPEGSVTTLAGCATCPRGSVDGAGANALFAFPWGIAVDESGNLYVADDGSFTIRRITPDGVVTTLAGLAGSIGPENGTGLEARFGGSFFNSLFFRTEFRGPRGVAVDRAGNVYVADYFNNTIRKGIPANSPPGIVSSGPGFGFSAGQFGFTFSGPGGRAVVVEISADLATWTPIWTNAVVPGLRFSDLDSAALARRFYRARIP